MKKNKSKTLSKLDVIKILMKPQLDNIEYMLPVEEGEDLLPPEQIIIYRVIKPILDGLENQNFQVFTDLKKAPAFLWYTAVFEGLKCLERLDKYEGPIELNIMEVIEESKELFTIKDFLVPVVPNTLDKIIKAFKEV